jgi:hypothetical protein
VLALGCTPELEPIRWEAIDVEALREAIAQPTGDVDEATSNEVGAAIVQRHEAQRVLAEYLHSVFVGAESGDQQPPHVAPQALDGTSVYLLVACPGPLGDYEQPFAHGSMRVDSPTLDAEVLSTLFVRGQLRSSFSDCRIDEYVFDGVARIFIDTEPSELGFVPELEVVRLRTPDEPYELREAMLWDAAGRVSALFELRSGKTLVLDWHVHEPELRLRGRNGELLCAVVGGSLKCDPP